MLSTKVIQELREEAKQLRNKAKLIESFLAGVEDERRGVPTTIQTEDEAGSFAGQIRAAMRQIGHSATSRQVEARMIQNGVEPERLDKPLRHHVAVALYSMSVKNTGGVKKVARGRYKIETNSHEAG